tara:strand:- start:296 stop:604 length:309 start_codon:yes stop_codon:yes gene_type:complete
MDYIQHNNIKIGGTVYTLIQHDKEWAEELEIFGKCDSNMLEIHLATVVIPRDVVRNTLIHEILHALYREYDIHEDDGEERTVTKLANGICQVALDNPWINKI